jgi:hypothetical protein
MCHRDDPDSLFFDAVNKGERKVIQDKAPKLLTNIAADVWLGEEKGNPPFNFVNEPTPQARFSKFVEY